MCSLGLRFDCIPIFYFNVLNKVIPSEEGEENSKVGKVVLESGEEIEYGYLVIATGTNAKWPVRLYDMPREEVLQGYQELAEKVKMIIYFLIFLVSDCIIMGFSRKKLYPHVEDINFFEVDSPEFPVNFIMTIPGIFHFFCINPFGNPRYSLKF